MAYAAWAAPFATAAESADQYPSKPIRLVIPYATGGVSDAIGRMLAKSMGDVLGQPV
ncbi:MAG: tripartite tricarboxylate transporter substrate binding protein, partial [Pigmentiphaga sp.]|nr:tripartite tricarboxylate transporter substrate binding protein [Pigmentiphaga sp.]